MLTYDVICLLQTRILVTHNLNFLHQMDGIVVMKDGQISEAGSYEELLKDGGGFAEFLKTHINAQDESSDESQYSTIFNSFFQ